MMAIVLATFLQAQQPSVDDRIADFLKGDAAARAELVKLGTGALASLRKARDKGPDKIDTLIYDIKKGAAHPRASGAIKPLEAKMNFKFENARYEEALQAWQELAGVNCMIDSLKAGDLKAESVEFAKDDITAREALDEICRRIGLDYGLFHNAVAIATPARLWGEGRTKGAFGPPAPERQHVTPEDQAPLEKVRKIQISLDMKNTTVDVASMYVEAISRVAIKVEAAPKETFSIRVKDLSILDALSLMTQCLDLDYVLEKGDVVVDTRAKIEKRVAGKK